MCRVDHITPSWRLSAMTSDVQIHQNYLYSDMKLIIQLIRDFIDRIWGRWRTSFLHSAPFFAQKCLNLNLLSFCQCINWKCPNKKKMDWNVSFVLLPVWQVGFECFSNCWFSQSAVSTGFIQDIDRATTTKRAQRAEKSEREHSVQLWGGQTTPAETTSASIFWGCRGSRWSELQSMEPTYQVSITQVVVVCCRGNQSIMFRIPSTLFLLTTFFPSCPQFTIVFLPDNKAQAVK